MTTTVHNTELSTSDPFLQPLMEYVISVTGLMYYSDRRREFASHVARRLDAVGLINCQAYLQFVKSGPTGTAELDCLIALLTIGETHFFRHRELFQALENTVFPRLIETNKWRRRLRIWSAGCSTGAEAYSVSMLLRRRFSMDLQHWDIRIIGTDINRDFLARAARGRFEDWALRTVSLEERNSCFLHDGKSWVVKPLFQQGVSFEYHNLASTRFISPPGCPEEFDLILCRNVMIYFSQDVVRQSIKNLHDCLAIDGWLAVGHAENNIDWFRWFRTVISDGAALYQRQNEHPAGNERGIVLSDAAETTAIPAPLRYGESTVTPALAFDLAVAVPERDVATSSESTAVDREPANDARNAHQEIRALADRGELVEALCRCREFQQSNALDPAPHFYQALIFQQRDDDAGAEQSLKRALYLDRHHLLAHYYLGTLFQKQRKRARAIRCFQNVIELLAGRLPGEQISGADELTVADLQGLSRAHLDTLEQT